MTGKEARDFVVAQIAATDTEGRHSSIKLSIELALDLLKLSPEEVGDFAEKLHRNGVAALVEHGIFGYDVSIDRNQKGHVVEFGA